MWSNLTSTLKTPRLCTQIGEIKNSEQINFVDRRRCLTVNKEVGMRTHLGRLIKLSVQRFK